MVNGTFELTAASIAADVAEELHAELARPDRPKLALGRMIADGVATVLAAEQIVRECINPPEEGEQ